MFCPYCGTKLVEGASFCTSCGKSMASALEFKQSTAELQAQQDAVRNREISTLENAISYFSRRANAFKEYDSVCCSLNYYARGTSNALLIWGSIITGLALLVLVALISDNESESIPILVFLFLLPGLGMLLGGIGMKVGNRRNYNWVKNQYAELSKELFDYYRSYPDCPVAPEFANPQVLKRFLSNIQLGRADTVKESVAMCIDTRRYQKIQAYFSELSNNTADVDTMTGVTKFFVPDHLVG